MMNSTSQFEIHPDAELLNGFVEQELRGAEREQVVVHLASCGRCRQIVYLSQDAAASMAGQPLELVAAMPAAKEHKRPWRGWQFLWAPAAAFATLAIVLFVHSTRQSERGQDVAKDAQSIAPAAMPTSASPDEDAATLAPRRQAAPVEPQASRTREATGVALSPVLAGAANSALARGQTAS